VSAPGKQEQGKQERERERPRRPEGVTAHGRLRPGALRAHAGTVAGAAILAVLLWHLGTGPLLDGLRRIDPATVLGALAIGGVTTVSSAWRWRLVARALRVRLPLGPAVADYYRALFLNAALPGGVLGDVHRAVRHGRGAGDVGRGVRAVVLERAAGQIALAVTGAAVLLTLPSPVRAQARQAAAPTALAVAVAGALAVLLALRGSRSAPSRRTRAARRVLGEARAGLCSRRNAPGVALSSAVVLAGHLAMFVVAARVAGCPAPVPVLLPPAVLALAAMGVPVNVGGFGPREGVTAWAFGAAGLGADTGVAVAVVYGVLGLVAALPGAPALVVGRRTRTRAASPAGGASPASGCTRSGGASPASGPAPPDGCAPDRYRPDGHPPDGYPSDVSSEKYGAKQEVRLASSSLPFAALPRDGRPMTPESV
jgi:uncharacterized membrane protein YbhN (UPF0104 family)